MEGVNPTKLGQVKPELESQTNTGTSRKPLSEMTIQEIASLTPPEPPPERRCVCGEAIEAFWLETVGKWTEDEKCSRCQELETAGARKRERLANIETMLDEAGVPRRFRRATLADLPPQLHGEVTGDLFLVGPPGVGKTHMAVAILREKLIETDNRYFRPWFIEIPELLMQIRQSFDGRGEMTEAGLLGRYGECSFLVLDDLGAEKASEWATQTLYLLINRRYREDRRTIITSNLSIAALSERLSDRIASRIAGMCKVIKLTGPDRRLKPAPSGG